MSNNAESLPLKPFCRSANFSLLEQPSTLGMKGSSVLKPSQMYLDSHNRGTRENKITFVGSRSGVKRNHNFAVNRRKLVCLLFFVDILKLFNKEYCRFLNW